MLYKRQAMIFKKWKILTNDYEVLNKKLKMIRAIKNKEELVRYIIRWKLYIKRKKKDRFKKLFADKIKHLLLLRRWRNEYQRITQLNNLMISLSIHKTLKKVFKGLHKNVNLNKAIAQVLINKEQSIKIECFNTWRRFRELLVLTKAKYFNKWLNYHYFHKPKDILSTALLSLYRRSLEKKVMKAFRNWVNEKKDLRVKGEVSDENFNKTLKRKVIKGIRLMLFKRVYENYKNKVAENEQLVDSISLNKTKLNEMGRSRKGLIQAIETERSNELVIMELMQERKKELEQIEDRVEEVLKETNECNVSDKKINVKLVEKELMKASDKLNNFKKMADFHLKEMTEGNEELRELLTKARDEVLNEVNASLEKDIQDKTIADIKEQLRLLTEENKVLNNKLQRRGKIGSIYNKV